MYYPPHEASREIKSRLKQGGVIVFTPHAEKQMLKRRIDAQEVNTAIRSAFVSTAGEQVRGEYRYKLASNLSGGLYVVVELPDDNPDIIIVTIFSISK